MNTMLLAHCGAEKVDRNFLSLIKTPPSTDTFKPVAHSVLMDAVEESLAFRHIRIQRSEFALSKDGMKMFGLIEVNQVYEGVQFAIGLRNANDKSMSLAMTAGYRVFVCDNMALTGDFYPLKAKHTKNLDMVESVSMGIDRIQRNWQPLRQEIDRKRSTYLEEYAAKLLIFDAFTKHKLPVSLFNSVTRSFKETLDDGLTTLWNLENNFTEAFKMLKPTSQFEVAAKLPKVLQLPA